MDKENATHTESTTIRKNIKAKKSLDGKQKAGLVALVVGIVALLAGVVFLLINVLKAPTIRDADYLVKVGAWQLQDEPTVMWNFTEIGKGTLTTNSHLNDYAFLWEMDGDQLKIETDWLYTLNDSYTYKLDQNKQLLTLSDESGDIYFVPGSSVNAEITEDD